MPDASAGGDLAHAWQGFNHVSLVTPDLDATWRSIATCSKMPVLFEGPGNPHHGRDALISVGGTGVGLHFFEVPNAEIFRYPTVVPSKLEFIAGALQHIAITIADEAAALTLRNRLQEHGILMTPVIAQWADANSTNVSFPGSKRPASQGNLAASRGGRR